MNCAQVFRSAAKVALVAGVACSALLSLPGSASASPWQPVNTADRVPFGAGGTLSTDIVDATGANFMWAGPFTGWPYAARFRNNIDFGNCFSARSSCSAPLQIAADDYAAVRVNGVFVGDYWLEDNLRPGGPPEFGEPAGQPMAVTFDLASFLTNDGANLIEIYACDAFTRPSPGSKCSSQPRGNHWVWLAGGVGYAGLTESLDYVSDGTWEGRPIPEPATMSLFGIAVAGLAGLSFRRRRAPLDPQV